LLATATTAILWSPIAWEATSHGPKTEGTHMDKKPMTAGEIAGRLAAEKIEPLVRLVEQATGKNLRLDAAERPAKPDRDRKPAE